MMTLEETRKTIDWLKTVIFKLQDREDAEELKETIDRLKDEITNLEERFDALRPGQNELAGSVRG